MRFFHIQSAPNDPANQAFAHICGRRSIDYVPVLASTLRSVLNDPPRRGDLLYCSGSAGPFFQVEALLTREGVVTLRNIPDAPFFDRPADKGTELLLLERKGVRVPRTAYLVDNNTERQSRSVQSVGGFPIVLRTSRAHEGIGIVKINNPASLPSAVNFMHWKGESSLVMQEFIEHASALKVLCIGERAVVGQRFLVPPNEFRTNRPGYDKNLPSKSNIFTRFTEEVERQAVAATRAIGVDSAVVNIVEGEDGRLVVTKAGFPFWYLRLEQVSGVPITDMLVDHLVEKSRSENDGPPEDGR